MAIQLPNTKGLTFREAVLAAVNSKPARKPPLLLCTFVLGSVAALCLGSAMKGSDRFDQYTYYFYDNGDPGHPGLVNVVATMALLLTSVISAFLAVTLRRSPWMVSAVLFLVIGVDYLVRAHNQVHAGDAFARVAYIIALAYVVRRLWRVHASSTTVRLVIAGFGCFVVSEIFDLLSNDPYGRGSALEEAAGCLGSWCFALAIFGFAQTSLQVAEPTGIVSGG